MQNSNKLVQGIVTDTNKEARTLKGAVTNRTSLSDMVNLFFAVGSARGVDMSGRMALAHHEDRELSLRLLQWLRDAREGSGERAQFRNLFRWLIHNDLEGARLILKRIPELGRWDDVLCTFNTPLEGEAVEMIREELFQAAEEGRHSLAAKWLPRQGRDAERLHRLLGWDRRYYRRSLVVLSKTVETQMCANKWNEIDLSQVPSVAFARYKRAFSLHAPQLFQDFVVAVQKGEAKINAGAIFPYDVVRSIRNSNNRAERAAADLQWKAMPNFLADSPDERVLVIADVSGSMDTHKVAGSVTALDACISLALYMSERLTGVFKDKFLTFSSHPQLQQLAGSLSDRLAQLETAYWAMSTDLQAAFNLILDTAVNNNVPQEDMPTKLMIISDMEFDCCGPARTNFEELQRKYEAAGYQMPQVVFWNMTGRVGNVPVTIKDHGTALISGFSPAVARSVLGVQDMTPMDIMLKTLLNPRYDLWN